MKTITIDLFAGMGGFALAAHWMGWEAAIFCEIDTNCQVVLAHHFPGAYIHGDIHTLTWTIINEEIEKRHGHGWRNSTRLVLCGGFPCQPYSAAGKRLGKEDARHLWPQMLRIIQECKPDAVVGENVSGILSWNGGLVVEEVQTDLEAQGFEVQAVVVPACSVGAPHRRDRVWFAADTTGKGLEGCKREINEGGRERPSEYGQNDGYNATNTDCERIQGREQHARNTIENRQGRAGAEKAGDLWTLASWQNFPTEPPLCTRNDGLSARLGRICIPGTKRKLTESAVNKMGLKMAGNAVVPQVVFQIFKALESTF